MRILIADDEPASVHLLGVILADVPQWRIVTACSGAEALRLAESGGIDLVLTDLLEPETGGGLELCRQIRGRSDLGNVPVVMMLNQCERQYLNQAYEAGACDYIMKPLDALEVLARIRAVLRSKEGADRQLVRERELEVANRELLRLSVVDAVTGVSNRRGFDQTLDRVWRSSARHQHGLALVMIDVDFFKLYNDRLGHPAGDQCLRRIAEGLASILKRPDDFLARYGGEEFAVILPQTDAAGAGVVAERLRASIEHLGIVHPASPVAHRVTISLGLACTSPGRSSDPSSLIAMADDALYEAKRSGRNRTCGRVEANRLSGFVAEQSHNRTPRLVASRSSRLKPQ